MNARPSGTIKAHWKTFSAHLLTGMNATDAYLLAGYRTTSRPSAQAAASRLLKHPAFAAYHEALRRRADAQSRRRTLHAIQRELSHLERVIQTSASTVPPRDRQLHANRATNRHGGRVIRLPCKLSALLRHTKLTNHQSITPHQFDPVFSKNHNNS